MDVIFDARDPDEFEAFLFLCIKRIAAQNKWPFKTACKYATLVWALTHPAVITVANVLGTRLRWELLGVEVVFDFDLVIRGAMNGAHVKLDGGVDLIYLHGGTYRAAQVKGPQ